MGFLDDILSTVNDFKDLRDSVMDEVSQTVSAIVEPIQEVKTTITDSSNSLMDSAGIQPNASSSTPSEE